MQAINLEAKLEVVLFAGTSFAILVKRGQIRKKSLQTVKLFSIMKNRVCYYKIDCKERDV